MRHAYDSDIAVHFGVREAKKPFLVAWVDLAVWMIRDVGKDGNVVSEGGKMSRHLSDPHSMCAGFR